MLVAKPCQQGLRPRTRFFGLEPLDLLFLFPGLFVCIILLRSPFLGVALTLASATALRLVKWGKLPGYSQALALYVLLPDHHAALGYDRGANRIGSLSRLRRGAGRAPRGLPSVVRPGGQP